MKILEEYLMEFPSNQNAIDLFTGEWSSKIPGDYTSGKADLFNDTRIDLISEEIEGFNNKTILELGPLEAAHTYMMSKTAKEIVSVEANSRAFVKCLIVKEILSINNANFLLGDFDKYLKECQHFDFILACGVIYHCKNPVETIVKLCDRTDQIGIWSHYFLEKQVRPKYGKKFSYQGEEISYQGYRATCYKHNYQNAFNIPGFCGGGNQYTNWMDRDSWIQLFDSLNFELKILSESEDHVHGPEFTAVATRKK